MTDPIYNPPSFFGPNAIKLPSQYRSIKVLGAGSYGEVVKCWKKDINQPVAVKIPLHADDNGKEIPMMQELMRLKADQHNIIKFLGWFNTRCGKALVFEMCDISIMDYILKTDCAPMRLSDISTIIKQLAEALKALKRFGVIHNDLKLDNIMMVNHRIRPFKVKLIDFGLALPTSEAKQGMDLLTINSSPEMILDLPFSEAIDMWSLGCAMATMIIGDYLLFGSNAYEAMHYNVEILGQPPDHLLDDGLKTENYFTRTESNSWRLKLRLEENNKNEAVERGQCIDLLEAMLEMDQAKRITPSEVLSHPFIDKGHQSSCGKKKVSEVISFGPKTRLPNVRVQPAAPENTLLMEDEESAETALEKDATISIHQEHHSPASLTVLPSGVILVQPAAPENTLLMEDEESAETALEKDATVSIHQEHHSPASLTVLPSGVILVQPAAPENTLLMEDEESAVRLQAETESSTVEVADSDTWTCQDSTSCDDTGTQQKKKKKKNCVRPFFSWMRKTFASCCTAMDDGDMTSEAL
ncbi:homeodomain-interacting protein kinase 2-like [Epinephelus fuscoguttatus]|uniref:homeodomain-interacting protein kinase 2-like n=1 Tax=Epinephelus fuscoguttatus TaxID=293821 RepID=UPI0020D0FD0C|nr:homeodomain-interacting protein kinase 2-like [Epinephelus fuscoguttatus]